MKTMQISSTGIMKLFAKHQIFVNIIPAMEYYYYVVYYHGKQYYDGRINAKMIMDSIKKEKGLPMEPMILSRILNIVYDDLSRIGIVPFANEFIEFGIEKVTKLVDPIELCLNMPSIQLN
jgi:hypothetical protein